MADPLDDLARAVVRAWAVSARAWFEAANAIGVSWLDVPDVESGRTGFNEEVVVVAPPTAPIDLHLEPFADLDDNQLPPGAVTVEPAQVAAGQETEVRLRVPQPEAVASGTYTGSISDSPGGTCLVDEITIYVVGGPSP